MNRLLAIVGAICVCKSTVAGETNASLATVAMLQRAVQVVPAPRQLAWQQREVEVFFHFGLNTMTQQEWGSGKESAALFNPKKLDAGQWCSAAKLIGAQGVVLVCKHHDGFCLWPSATTDYSVRNSPWREGKGDLVRELSEACRAAGMKFGVYLSPADRHQPSFGTPAYNDVYRAQLRELLTGYGEISEVWMDGAFPDGKAETVDFPSFYRLVRELQPNAVIVSKGPDVRWVGNEGGSAREAEWNVVPLATDPEHFSWPNMQGRNLGGRDVIQNATHLYWYPAVANLPLDFDWFWDPQSEKRVKSLHDLQKIYELSVGRNAGLLLNLAPNREGLIPGSDVSALQSFGRWITDSFGTNLVEGVVAERSTDSTGNTEIVYRLPRPRYVTTLMVGEDITQGQRVESFKVDLLDADKWHQCGQGSTIGWKRLVRWQPQRAEAVRIRITGTRADPRLRFAGLYAAKW
ncbi:MAG TPA: alpha-L-fucosidase [Candidatus Limnocylindria bacterium]|nr:alpha-L-fucosidase [Candidatus Limnocylindria bacterium]